MTMDLVLVTFTLVAIIAVYVVFKENRTKRQLKNFTSPPGLPILRHFFAFTSDKKLLPNLLDFTLKYGKLLKLDLVYGLSFTLVSDPEFLKYLLGTTSILNKTDDYDFLNRWLGTGLLTTKREKWEKTRKILNPAFHVQILEKYVDVFHSVSDVLLRKLKLEAAKEDAFDVYPHITLCTLDIICETAMGTKLNAQEGKHQDYVASVKEMCRIIIHRAQSPWKAFEVIYFFSRDYWKERRALKTLHKLTNTVIQSRKSELSKDKAETDEEEKSGKKKLSFLDLLLAATIDGRPLTDDEIRQEVDTIMFAGHDTTAAGMAFTLYCLAVNPDIQERALREQEDLFGADRNRPATAKDLQCMKYLDAVIKEALRLYPPVPIFGRSAAKDTPYYGGGMMPKKMSISVFAYGLHRNPEYHPEPEKFDPDRFDQANAQPPPYTYVPFSAGPRGCIGQRFAQLEMKVVVSKMLRNFELLPVPDFAPELLALTVLRSKNGIVIRLKERA